MFSKLEPNTCTCRCVAVIGYALLAENRVGNGDLQSRLPAFLPYAPSCWAAAACGHRRWVRALHMARTSNGLTPRSRLSVAVKLQRVSRPARRHCATEHPVRSLGGAKHTGISGELVLPLIADGMKQSLSVVPCLLDSRENRLQCGRSGRPWRRAAVLVSNTPSTSRRRKPDLPCRSSSEEMAL